MGNNKIYIKFIELNNFQKHSHLKLNLVEGVNILYGRSDAGKSCIRRALSWVYYNEPGGDVVRKTDTKKTSVKVVLNNNVAVERIKTNSINRYVLYKNKQKKEYNSIGRNIPEDIQKALKISKFSVDSEDLILNISNQVSLPFLFDKPATFRHKLFNKLTGNDIIDKLLGDFNKEILRNGRKKTNKEEILEQKESELEKLNYNRKTLEKKYKKLNDNFSDIKELDSILSRLKEYKSKLNKISKESEKTKEELKKYKKDFDIKHCFEMVEKYKTLKDLKDTFGSISKNIESTEIEIEYENDMLEENKSTYKDILTKIKTCPLCETKLTKDHINNLLK